MKKIWFILFCLPLLSCFGRELEGFNAIVTGGSRGIGEASAYALAREGANVAIAVDKSLEEGAIVVDNLKALEVNTISPGYIKTKIIDFAKELHPIWIEKTPMHTMGSPEDIAEAVLYLASSKVKYVTGADWIIDGGYTCS